MSGIPSPQPFSSDDDILSPFEMPAFFKADQKNLKSQSFLYPIDEADDFYNPFSDLSLFLSNKIKKEIQNVETTKKWSRKIESNLLTKILPEFKKYFPRYRLGPTALKKVWDKVNYYYEKIQTHKGAFHKDGKLNLSLMIRENLRAISTSESPLNLPPYHLSYQIAMKISECMATLEGCRPDLDQLAKIIWSVQKNTLQNLSPMAAKSPYEDYDKLDKLIIKTLLEICSEYPQLTLKILKIKIMKRLQTFSSIHSLAKKSHLTSTLSMILADKLCPLSFFDSEFIFSEKQTLEKFIDIHINFSKKNKSFLFDNHSQELVQRILALYPIVKELPTDLSETTLRKTIQDIYLNKDHYSTNSSLYVFIHAEMHLIQNDQDFENLKDLENEIVEVFQLTQTLPLLNQNQFEAFELLIWKKINNQKKFLSDIPKRTLMMLEREISNVIIDNPNQSFRGIIRTTLQFFRKIQQLPFHEKQNKRFWLTLKKKCEVWVMQNEMICRWIHFDDQTPLFSFFKQEWKEQKLQSDLSTAALKKFPILTSFKTQLTIRLWILEQYFWYSQHCNDSKSPYERFLKKYFLLIQKENPNQSYEQLLRQLENLSHTMLPFTPFMKITL